ncbi:glycosyltransferase family 2 protein [Caballeronia sp. M1242]|uniref:glycosyltransferase family 2 protein n=1 Tax=Caballeronia sp. M1242 TaxID=2814653 RepID=UPI0019D0A109|nr:glycosyltransferase family 2 protein [Caballeronia sp. M1242]QSN61154.1 glycosyltransferase family 2 protein [Caballeronia sp. M1242]
MLEWSKTQCVSVVVPCFNEVRTLGRALESCLRQPEVGQVIVVDDGSQDNSVQVAQFFAMKDSRVELLRLPENFGAARARNLGVQRATLPVLAFLDADDEYLPSALTSAVKYLREHRQMPAIRLRVHLAGYPAEVYAFANFNAIAFNMSTGITSSLVIRRDMFNLMGGFPEDEVYRRYGGEDHALQSVIVELFGCEHMFDRPHVRNYWHPESHVGRYFIREIRGLETPEENQEVAIATAAFSEQVRLRLAAADAIKSASNAGTAPSARDSAL